VSNRKENIRRQQYHLVREVIKNPRNTVSSRSGARTPAIPTKQAVLQQKINTINHWLKNPGYRT